MSRPAQPIVIRNLMPLAGWIIMALWLFGLCMFTWLFFRDGGFNQFEPVLEAGVLALFWLFGWAGSTYIFGFALTHVTIHNGIVHIRQRWLFRRQEDSFAINRLPAPVIRQEKDSDGDPYFRLTLTAGDRDITLREGNDRDSLEQLLSRLISEAGFQRS